MDTGDLFYIIILALFMILGFFNDSKKKKNEQKRQPEPKYNPFDIEDIDEYIPPLSKKTPPPLPEDIENKMIWEKESNDKYSKAGRVVFQSSMDLITDFKKESSLGNSFTSTNTDYIYEQTEDSQETNTSRSKDKLMHHSIIKDFTGENHKSELKKGIIYSEILKRKY